MKKWLLCVFLGCSCLLSARAETIPKETMTELIRNVFLDEGIQRNIATEFGVSGEKALVVRQAYRAYGQSDAMVNYLADQMQQLGLTDVELYKDPEKAASMLVSSFTYLGLALYRQGLMKVDTPDLEEFLRHQIRVSRVLPDDVCKDFNLGIDRPGLVQDVQAITPMVMRRMSTPDLRRYFSHLVRTQLAALDDLRSPRTLMSQERALATQALERALYQGMLKLPEREALRMAMAIQDLRAASDKDACDCSIFMYRQMLKTTGQSKAWILRLMVEGLQ